MLYQYGEITEIRIVPQSMAAFVTYAKREEAEKAAETLHNNFHVKEIPLRISWTKPTQPSPSSLFPTSTDSTSTQPTLQQPPQANNFFNLPVSQDFSVPTPSKGRSFYPSMDPSRLGGKRDY